MKRIAVIVTARPSWAKLSTVCGALRAKGADVQIIAAASALLERYGRVVDVIKAEGYKIAAECWTVFEGENLLTSAKETGALLSDLASYLRPLQPDCVVVCADRHEVLAAAQAASYLQLPLAHLQGGEQTGSIDDKIRNAITYLADYHFVATQVAKYRVCSLLGRALGHPHVYQVGCPSLDLAKEATGEPPVTSKELGGSGPDLDLNRPFVVVMMHPVTGEWQEAYTQMWTVLEGVGKIKAPRIVFWPGEDAGGALMSKAIRVFKDRRPELTIRTVRNLPPKRFLRLLTQAGCLVGNSSVGIRECSYLGVPVVNVGNRQMGRERGPNVIDVRVDCEALYAATAATTAARVTDRERSSLYGDGTAGEQIAEILCSL